FSLRSNPQRTENVRLGLSLVAALLEWRFRHSPSFSWYQISNQGESKLISRLRKYPELIRKKLCSHLASSEAKVATIWLKASGCSRFDRCAACGMTARLAWGM